jgi:hypothetical protein
MKNRTRISYHIVINDGCDDGYPYWLFRSFRRAMRHLVKLNDIYATLSRVEHKGNASPYRPWSGLALAYWMIDQKGQVIRFDRRWSNLARKQMKARAWAKDTRLTDNGQPYTIPPVPDDSSDIPF